MKRKRYTEAQIVSILKQGEAGTSVADLCREYGISSASYYQWKSRYGGMSVSDLQRLKQLEADNRRLKQMYATLSMDHELLREVLEKKYGVDLSEER